MQELMQIVANPERYDRLLNPNRHDRRVKAAIERRNARKTKPPIKAATKETP